MFRFPWGDMHSLNLGWFLQKFNELREDWATAEAGIDGALDAEIQKAEDAISDVFDARDAAAASATAAAGSASAANTSKTAAQNSATAAASSATLANQKASAAGLSEAAAAQSATQAGNSATAAAGSATQAGNSATAAGNSATAAAASETAAGNSATAAAASETAAAASESAAAESESAAAESAADAAQSVLSTIPSTSAMLACAFLSDFSQTSDGRAYALVKNKFSSRFAGAGSSTRLINITGSAHVARGQALSLNTVTDKYVDDFVPFKIGEATARATINKIKVNCLKVVSTTAVIKFFACLANIENDVITVVNESAITLYSGAVPGDSEILLSNIEADYIALYILTTNSSSGCDAYIDMERVNPSAALGTTLIRPGLDLTVEPETEETI